MTIKTYCTQDQALAMIRESWNYKGNYLLMGGAGVGKTHLTKNAILAYNDAFGHPPLMLAPTHKALRNFRDTPCARMTIHKFLKSRPFRDEETNELKFAHRSKDDDLSDIEGARWTVIDEVGMITKAHNALIRQVLPNYLSVGDPDQLPPVRETVSEAFQGCDQTMILTKDYRSPGPLSELKMTYRTEEPDPLPSYLDLHATVKMILSEPDCYAIAHTNKRVDEINRRVRLQKFGRCPYELMKGDRILSTRSTKSEAICSNDIFTVLSAQKCSLPLVGRRTLNGVEEEINEDFDAFYCELQDQDGNEDVVIILSQESAEYAVSMRLDEMLFRCNPQMITYLHAYAITAYRSQGSTINSVIVDLDDIDRHSKGTLTRQLKYVAISRARSFLAGLR